jgi:hypothetical protein
LDIREDKIKNNLVKIKIRGAGTAGHGSLDEQFV